MYWRISWRTDSSDTEKARDLLQLDNAELQERLQEAGITRLNTAVTRDRVLKHVLDLEYSASRYSGRRIGQAPERVCCNATGGPTLAEGRESRWRRVKRVCGQHSP
jgi:hypothetical protein